MTNTLHKLKAALAVETLTHTTLADDSGVLLDIKGGKVLTLNSTGETLVKAIESGAGTVEEMAQLLVQKHGISEELARQDTEEFLDQLLDRLGMG